MYTDLYTVYTDLSPSLAFEIKPKHLHSLKGTFQKNAFTDGDTDWEEGYLYT